MIENFVSEPFWKLIVEHTRESHKVEFLWDRNRLFDRDTVDILHDECKETKEAHVEKVAKKPKSKWRPQALDTVELEKLGISKLRMSAKQTMQVAEKLYSKGFISYPRTETNKFPAGLNLTPLVQQQTQSNIWGDFANEVLKYKIGRFRILKYQKKNFVLIFLNFQKKNCGQFIKSPQEFNFKKMQNLLSNFSKNFFEVITATKKSLTKFQFFFVDKTVNSNIF